MLNKIKDVADELNINIVYGNLPGEEQSVYVERETLKIIMISKEIKGTDLAVEEIALNLGYIKVMDHLGIKVNEFKEEIENNVEVRNLAKKFQLNLILNSYESNSIESFLDKSTELIENIKKLEGSF